MARLKQVARVFAEIHLPTSFVFGSRRKHRRVKVGKIRTPMGKRLGGIKVEGRF